MFRESEKEILLTQNDLGTPHPFILKSSQDAQISHTNHILPRHFQDAF